MKKILKDILLWMKPFFLFISNIEVELSTKWVNSAWKRRYLILWGGVGTTPEFFDHRMDLYYQWPVNRVPFWLERGCYNLLALKMFEKAYVLELCCGDGFNAKHFYASSCKKIVCCDFDKEAIALAKKSNTDKNIEYIEADIRYNIPIREGGFTNIIWDAAIEHFTEEEIEKLMHNIKSRLTSNGILSGYTITRKEGGKQLEQHEYEFKNMDDLKRFLTPYFSNVYVFETIYEERRNLYFYASDGLLPFMEGWKHCSKELDI